MVKGVSKRVVVVKAPQGALFEEAIFILKENVHHVGEAQVLKEACAVANEYVTQRPRALPKPVFALIGAFLTGIAWVLTSLLK